MRHGKVFLYLTDEYHFASYDALTAHGMILADSYKLLAVKNWKYETCP